MYRDSATALDEHDRAVGAILIAEAMIDRSERAAARAEATTGEERWRAIAELHDAYPEIWRYLDRARDVLAARGTNTAAYDELRPLTRRAPTEQSSAVDSAALDDARRAIEELKLAVPGADWVAIDRRTEGLVRVPLSKHRRQRLAISAICAVAVLLFSTWVVSAIPEHRDSQSVAMHKELAGLALQRKLKINTLVGRLGDRCDVELARELTRQLALDGRTLDASDFGQRFQTRCGADRVVDQWAHAPSPQPMDYSAELAVLTKAIADIETARAPDGCRDCVAPHAELDARLAELQRERADLLARLEKLRAELAAKAAKPRALYFEDRCIPNPLAKGCY